MFGIELVEVCMIKETCWSERLGELDSGWTMMVAAAGASWRESQHFNVLEEPEYAGVGWIAENPGEPGDITSSRAATRISELQVTYIGPRQNSLTELRGLFREEKGSLSRPHGLGGPVAWRLQGVAAAKCNDAQNNCSHLGP
jgi:hypothetical protein